MRKFFNFCCCCLFLLIEKEKKEIKFTVTKKKYINRMTDDANSTVAEINGSLSIATKRWDWAVINAMIVENTTYYLFFGRIGNMACSNWQRFSKIVRLIKSAICLHSTAPSGSRQCFKYLRFFFKLIYCCKDHYTMPKKAKKAPY